MDNANVPPAFHEEGSQIFKMSFPVVSSIFKAYRSCLHGVGIVRASVGRWVVVFTFCRLAYNGLVLFPALYEVNFGCQVFIPFDPVWPIFAHYVASDVKFVLFSSKVPRFGGVLIFVPGCVEARSHGFLPELFH